jgi:hypothetical protein
MKNFRILLLVLAVVLSFREQTIGRENTVSQCNAGVDEASHVCGRQGPQAIGPIEIFKPEVKYEVLENWVPS